MFSCWYLPSWSTKTSCISLVCIWQATLRKEACFAKEKKNIYLISFYFFKLENNRFSKRRLTKYVVGANANPPKNANRPPKNGNVIPTNIVAAEES